MTDKQDQVNRDHWKTLGLNDGKYIDDAEDRTNYLLLEHGRLRGEVERLREGVKPPTASEVWTHEQHEHAKRDHLADAHCHEWGHAPGREWVARITAMLAEIDRLHEIEGANILNANALRLARDDLADMLGMPDTTSMHDLRIEARRRLMARATPLSEAEARAALDAAERSCLAAHGWKEATGYGRPDFWVEPENECPWPRVSALGILRERARTLAPVAEPTPKDRDKAQCLARWNEAGERIAECGERRDGDGCDSAERDQQNWALALDLHSGATAESAWAELRRRYDLLAAGLMARGGTNFINACRAAVAEERWGDLVGRIADLEWDHVGDGRLRWVKNEHGILVTESTGKPPCRIPENVDPGSPFAGEYPRAPWRPKVGDRVRTAEKLTHELLKSDDFVGDDQRRPNASGVVFEADGWGCWIVRHDNGTEAPYDEDELRPAHDDAPDSDPDPGGCAYPSAYLHK